MAASFDPTALDEADIPAQRRAHTAREKKALKAHSTRKHEQVEHDMPMRLTHSIPVRPTLLVLIILHRRQGQQDQRQTEAEVESSGVRAEGQGWFTPIRRIQSQSRRVTDTEGSHITQEFA